ncbi:MAG: U32 family peptidase [Candidatus Omnitrophica bacterium]|nr:U32 family peptidase [Candidatus Omnitrophota bacterium]MBU4477900.1 U32 family peptidase [Candidatus Omnitrophota bacterium]MCG2704203.1 U32 family peptidase [Candidatus Omnitrophota bacterium]
MRIAKPELIAPAGDWASLVSAVENGADSVYFGVKGLNMRNLAGNFDLLEFKKITDFLHSRARKGYLALNVLVRNSELKKIETILRKAKTAAVDAVILWDAAVLAAAKRIGIAAHLSTQASVANSAGFEFYSRLGVKRIVLARECTLREIAEIARYKNKNKLRAEIEAFIHGAMCISISGRCFLSGYSSGKAANRGECLQYCRREFLIKDTQEGMEYTLGRDYVLSAKDLCTIDFIEQLLQAGISAFKIEGRGRSAEYVSTVTSVYRRAIDAGYEGRLDPGMKARLKEELAAVFNRGFSSGFYFGYPLDAQSRGLENKYEKVFLGEVARFFKKINVAEILLRNGALRSGQEILIIGKKTPARVTIAAELQQEHKFVETAAQGTAVGVKLSFSVRPRDKVFLWRPKTDNPAAEDEGL